MADSDSDIQASGGDYTSLQAWIDAYDEVTGTHTAHVADEYVDGNVFINNGSTTATAFVIKPQTGAEHNGTSRNVASAGSALRHTDYIIWWGEANGASLTIQDMSLEKTASSYSLCRWGDASSDVTLLRCILEQRSTSASYQIENTSLNSLTIESCVMYGGTRGIDSRLLSACVLIGNTVHANGGYGILPPTGNGAGITVANNISVGHTSEDYYGSATGNTNHGSNIASDASATTEWDNAGGSVNSAEVLETADTPTGDYVAFVDLTAGSEDYHLVDLAHGSYDNVAIEGGISGLGDELDIDGEARHVTTPDIGADEMAAAVGGDEGAAVYYYNQLRTVVTG